jgi:hypothetical protein
MVVPVTILRPTVTTGVYGDENRDWSNPTTTTTTGWLGPVSSSEPVERGRDQLVTTTDVLMLEPTEAVDVIDRIIVDGITYEVNGHPVRARTPRGVHHLEVPLRAVEG